MNLQYTGVLLVGNGEISCDIICVCSDAQRKDTGIRFANYFLDLWYTNLAHSFPSSAHHTTPHWKGGSSAQRRFWLTSRHQQSTPSISPSCATEYDNPGSSVVIVVEPRFTPPPEPNSEMHTRFTAMRS